MSAVRIQNFGGMIPILDDTALPDMSAAYCRNTWLYGANLQGFRKATQVYTVKSPTTRSVYRIPQNMATADDFSLSTWMEFPFDTVDVVQSPTIEDIYQRYYIFSPGQVPAYNTLPNILTNQQPYTLGVTAPTVAPEIVVEGGTSTVLETRSYVYTWQTQFGEEGAPSPPTTVTGTSDGLWGITVSPPATSDLVGRALSTVNLYRTVTSSAGNSTYNLVASFPVTTLSFADTLLDTAITGNITLQSTFWSPPPADLQGAVLMPGGIIAAWRNEKEVWFSEAYRPHAWPAAYSINVPFPIVGMGVSGNTLVVVTKGWPTAVTGLTPDTMTPSQITAHEPGVSRRAIVSSAAGIYFASENGVVLATAGATMNMTTRVISRQQWTARNPSTMIAAGRNTSFFMVYQNQSPPDNGLVFDPISPGVSMVNIQTDMAVTDMFADLYTGDIMLLYGGAVYRWDDPTQVATEPYLWRSKVIQVPYAQEFYGAKVYFNVPASVTIPTPSPATRNTAQPQTFDPTTQYAVLRVYGNGVLILTRELQVSGEIVVFPGGTKCDFWQVEIEGQVVVSSIQMATSIKELRTV